MNYKELLKKFPSQDAVIEHFTVIRYKYLAPTCSRCKKNDKIVLERHRLRYYHCNSCNTSFSVFKGTIFEKSTTDLRTWMYAIHLYLNAKKGISCYQLQRETGVAPNTARRMVRQIRIAMGNVSDPSFINTILEIDETYVGGKPRKDNYHTKTNSKRGRGTDKTPVVGILDSVNKRVYAKVMLPNKAGKKLTSKQLMKVITKVASKKNVFITDQFPAYNILDKHGYNHKKVDHSQSYSNRGIHINNIECFWNVFKRGFVGVYHHVSDKHLQKYVDEFCFRYNNLHNKATFDTLLEQCVMR